MTRDTIFKRAFKKAFVGLGFQAQIEPSPEAFPEYGHLEALLTLILDATPEPDAIEYYKRQSRDGRSLESLMDELFESERVQQRLSRSQTSAGPINIDQSQLAQLMELMLGHEVSDGDAEYRAGRIVQSGSFFHAFGDILESERFQERVRSMKNLFVNPGHFYSPVVDVEKLPFEKLKTVDAPSVNNVDIDREGMIETWNSLVPFIQAMPFTTEKTDEFRYYFNNVAYNYGDAAIYFALLQANKPKRIIEVGSGYSSALLLDTVDNYFDQRPEITFIDPYPELLRNLITEDQTKVSIIAENVQDVDLNIFGQLDAGDFLFIDSTHILKTHSDVLWELTEILPRLAPGVIIHFHDIFWPFEYREVWIKNPPRSWNEAYALQLFLMYQTDYEIMFFNDYFAMQCAEIANKDVPRFATSDSAGLWLRKRGKPS